MDLTPRQKEVAQLVASGMSNKAIAERMGLSTDTVHDHIRAAAQRIDADGRPRFKLTMFVLFSLTAPE